MADKIVAEYTVKVDQALKDLNKLAARVDKVDDERKKVQDGFKDMSKGMVNDFKKVGAAVGLAFGVDQLVSFGKEAVKVAAQAEGIRTAFGRLNQPNLLNELRKATRGAVDDITLMRQAIRAQNFKVPLEQLGTFFEFATKRSIQTGESVDYLVNSIIDGIGRKSTLVLDNLGISATELQEEMKKTGDFGAAAGAIIARELEKAGDVADTTAIKLARLDTTMQNLKVTAGEMLIDFGDFALILDDISKITNLSATGLNNYTQRSAEAGKAITELSLARNEEIGVLERYRILLFGLTDAQREEIKLSRESNELSEDEYVTLSKLNQLYSDLDVKEKEQIKNLAYYNQLIKDLQSEQAGANTTRERVRELEDEINEAIRQRLILLGKLRVVGSGDEERLDLVRSTAARMTDAEFDAAKNSLVIQQQLTDDILADYEHRNGEIEAAIEKRNEIEARLAEERKQQEQQAALEVTQQSLNTISSLTNSIYQIQQNAFIREEQELQRQLEKGLITREQYETELDKIRQKQAAANKDAAIFQATISTAQAVVAALGSIPFSPANIALAATIGAAGAAQIAAIASQPLPQFAEGGFVLDHGEIKGRSHKQGGVHIEAEGGEFITSAKHAQQNADILKAINSGQWEKYKMENIIAPAINQVLEGGFENMGASYTLNTGWTDKNLLRQGDRNRYAMRDGFVYLGKEIRSLKEKRNRWN